LSRFDFSAVSIIYIPNYCIDVYYNKLLITCQ
jgi:hypothetical protein